MANDVFANGREISCKAADGKSVAAFPDVCFTPPECPATPPGVPIPYPNTAFAKDTTNGSKTVKISGKEVMLKNVSYFKTSTGDEPGCAAKKGVLTSVNKGKAYFTSWSMDVKFEGKNVVRHLDLTTHNHASQPGNTPPWVYADTASLRKACQEELNEAKRKCQPTAEEKNDFKRDQERANKRRKKKRKRKKKVRKMGWKDAHCKGLLRIKPYTDIERVKAAVEKTIEDIEDKIENFKDILIEKGIDMAWEKAEKTGAKALVKYTGSAAGGPIAPFLGALSTIHTVVDGLNSTVTGAADVYINYQEIKDKIGSLDKIMKQVQQQLKDVKKGAKLLEKEKNKTITAAEQKKLDRLKAKIAKSGRDMANAQAAQAKTDPCIKALKCILIPYNQKSGMETKKGTKPRKGGCCPGQTGHHLPPKAYFHDCKEKGKYNKDKALVVCAEGVDQHSGSHMRLHDEQDKAAKILIKNNDLSFKDAINASVTAHKNVYRHCSSKCIRKQIYESLKQCEKSKINPINKNNKSLITKQADAGFVTA